MSDEPILRPYVDSVRVADVALLLLAAFLGSVALDVALGFDLLRPVLAFGVFIVVPGGLLLTRLGYGPRIELDWLLYAVGTSLLLIMSVGLALNLLLTPVGVSRPLSASWLGVANVGVLLLLALVVRTGPTETSIAIPDRAAVSKWVNRYFRPTTFALLLLPPLTILSVHWLNLTSDNRPLIAVLVVIATLPLLIALGLIARRWIGLAVGAASISLLYHDSLWAFSRFSGQGNIIDAWQTGRWLITERSGIGATTPLLPNVTLSPTFAHLGGIDIFTQIDVFNPLFVALIPLGSYALFRRFFEEEFAALGAFLMMFIHPFYIQLPSGGRAATPVLFLVFMAVTATESDLNPVVKRGLALAFGTALITSHYGASYFVMAALGVTVVLRLQFHAVDKYVSDSQELDGGRLQRARASIVNAVGEAKVYVLSVAFVGFYYVTSFGWYRYTFEGQKVSTFFTRVRTALIGFLSSGAGGGGTANRVTREYGIESVLIARRLYLLIALLTAVGVLFLVVRRLVYREWKDTDGFDDFLALGMGLLAVFSLTFALRALWGGGRPMAITFSITASFAFFGVYAGLAVGANVVRRLAGRRVISPTRTKRIAGATFAVLIAALLLLNSGVVAATVLGGQAPSEVPLHQSIEERSQDSPGAHRTVHFDQDVSMYVWLQGNADSERTVYSDMDTRTAANDWYAPHVTAGTDPETRASLDWNPNLFGGLDHESGYVALSSHNVNLNLATDPDGESYRGARSYRELTEVRAHLSDESKVYTNGDSEVYVLTHGDSGRQSVVQTSPENDSGAASSPSFCGDSPRLSTVA